MAAYYVQFEWARVFDSLCNTAFIRLAALAVQVLPSARIKQMFVALSLSTARGSIITKKIYKRIVQNQTNAYKQNVIKRKLIEHNNTTKMDKSSVYDKFIGHVDQLRNTECR